MMWKSGEMKEQKGEHKVKHLLKHDCEAAWRMFLHIIIILYSYTLYI